VVSYKIREEKIKNVFAFSRQRENKPNRRFFPPALVYVTKNGRVRVPGAPRPKQSTNDWPRRDGAPRIRAFSTPCSNTVVARPSERISCTFYRADDCPMSAAPQGRPFLLLRASVFRVQRSPPPPPGHSPSSNAAVTSDTRKNNGRPWDNRRRYSVDIIIIIIIVIRPLIVIVVGS